MVDHINFRSSIKIKRVVALLSPPHLLASMSSAKKFRSGKLVTIFFLATILCSEDIL